MNNNYTFVTYFPLIYNLKNINYFILNYFIPYVLDLYMLDNA